MNRIVLIHFAPLELYPPVQNFLRFLDEKSIAKNVMVITTASNANLPLVVTNNIKIFRCGKSRHHFGKIKRYINYLRFYFSSIRLLFYYRPGKIFYYETLSSFPAYVYRKINKKVEIFIHYHEYVSKQEYKNGMKLARLFHRFEQELYPTARSVSHTNSLRMEKFKKDIAPIALSKDCIIPNYPPSDWRRDIQTDSKRRPLKIIYIGALSLATMYTRKFAEWVLSCNGNVTWDIFSLNYKDDAAKFISSLHSPWITLREGVDYSSLPSILCHYHVGVILYNGHIPNYIYNAPNKMFEYLACGLDVWFPKEMIGCYDYVTEKTFPKVQALDFQNLSALDLHDLISRNELTHQPSSFYCEQVYEKLYEKLAL